MKGGDLDEHGGVLGLRKYIVHTVRNGGRSDGLMWRKEENMPIVFAIAGTTLADFALGAVLGASVYLVSRGVRNQLKNRRK